MAPVPAAFVHVDSPQTAVPTRPAEPGRTRHIAVAAPPLPASALQWRTRVVLYYRADADGGAAPLWEEAVWAKESLSEALAGHREMAGRLRRHEDGSWEVKPNDAGVRFVHATAEASVEEFLAAAKDKNRRARWEAALAPWVDVNAEDPDICALFYLQVTRFQGDEGYAVGVSCSLMLAEPVALARFLLSWADTHAKMKAQNKLAPNPMMQYARYFQRPGVMAVRALGKTIALDTPADGGDKHVHSETALFRASSTGAKAAPDIHRAIAGACVGQVSERFAAADKAPSRISVVLVGGGTSRMSVETCAVDGEPGSGCGEQFQREVAQWKELGLEELVVRDSKPVHVSYSIVTGGGNEGHAVVMPDGAAGDFLVTATITK